MKLTIEILVPSLVTESDVLNCILLDESLDLGAKLSVTMLKKLRKVGRWDAVLLEGNHVIEDPEGIASQNREARWKIEPCSEEDAALIRDAERRRDERKKQLRARSGLQVVS